MMSKMEQTLFKLMDLGFTRFSDRIGRATKSDRKLVATRCFYDLCRDAPSYPERRAQYVAAIGALHDALVELELGEGR